MEANEILNKVGQFAAPLVATPGVTQDDAVKIGAAFLSVAEEIFKAVGGSKMAAAQFYAAADRLAGDVS
jgi:hypothetical protein